MFRSGLDSDSVSVGGGGIFYISDSWKEVTVFTGAKSNLASPLIIVEDETNNHYRESPYHIAIQFLGPINFSNFSKRLMFSY